ncbi:MAG: hypothetical protein JRF25_05645 [Deltaproteobacteria bacterium]|nr:hypothetical protein [Deltaproteobacteria bacterium]
MALNEPVYIESFKKGLLKKKAEAAWDILKSCVLCPRKCGVDRQSGETGVCKTGMNALVSSYNPHFGEEAPLVGSHGSGTIFFTHCNLLQNFDISHQGYGEEISNEQLADLMLQLQNLGCHNINFVTPTHIVPHILKALEVAVKEGLSVPLEEYLKVYLIFICPILNFGALITRSSHVMPKIIRKWPETRSSRCIAK